MIAEKIHCISLAHVVTVRQMWFVLSTLKWAKICIYVMYCT